MNDQAKEIATTILNQLGGRRFLAMTGAKNLLVLDCKRPFGLRMKLPRNKSGANFLTIVLEDDDTYTLNWKYFHLNMKTFEETKKEIGTETMVHAEDLEKFFTATTGIYTRL